MEQSGTTTAANRGSKTNGVSGKLDSDNIQGEAIGQFKNAMFNAGLIAPDNLTTGKIIAFPGLNKPKNNKAGRCFLFPDRRGGWFMDYSTGLFEVWQAKHDKPYTEQERQAFKEQCERDRLAREQETNKAREAAAKKAVKIWESTIFADTDNHYLYLKNVMPHGTKTGDSGSLKGILIVPVYDESLKLVNLQFIAANSEKRFLTGGQKKNCFWWLGKKTPTVLIAEGFSTSASLHENTGLQTFIAFDADNLINVAQIVRAKNADAEIIICGDNDKSGTGQRAAQVAALAIGGKYILPAIVGHDFNDELANAGSHQ